MAESPAGIPAAQPATSGAGGGAGRAPLDAKRLRGLIVTNLGASVAFTVMYATQPILPQIGDAFRVGPAQAGLTLLAVTVGLAFSSLGAGRLADALGARRVMLASSVLLTLLSVAVALAPSFRLLVALRGAQGLVVPGVTVAGLAYLHNALPASWRGRVSGFYIATNTLGGLAGRLGVGLTVDALGWRGGLGLVAVAAAGGTLALALGMPRDDAAHAHAHAHAVAMPAAASVPPAHRATLREVAARLWWAPLIGGCVFFPFLTVFTYTPYRLEGPPFGLTARDTSLLYLVYVLGAVASPLAGNISDRIGRRPAIQASLAVAALGLALSLVDALPVVIVALALVCVGSLMAHVVANASVSDGANPLGADARATALALYTLGFYLGGGLGSSVPGIGWERLGWGGVLLPCAAALGGALLCSLRTPLRPRVVPAALPSTNIP